MILIARHSEEDFERYDLQYSCPRVERSPTMSNGSTDVKWAWRLTVKSTFLSVGIRDQISKTKDQLSQRPKINSLGLSRRVNELSAWSGALFAMAAIRRVSAGSVGSMRTSESAMAASTRAMNDCTHRFFLWTVIFERREIVTSSDLELLLSRRVRHCRGRITVGGRRERDESH